MQLDEDVGKVAQSTPVVICTYSTYILSLPLYFPFFSFNQMFIHVLPYFLCSRL
ncbi:hypothetical protein BKA69DRAFT_1050301, partial [Paraphysoderma sedebokerense]